MAAITWTGSAGDGNFNNPLNWSPQQVPGAADTVTISPAAAAAISATTEAVAGLTTNANVTLTVANNNNFTIGSGAAATFTNSGNFVLNSGGNTTQLVIGAARVTLNGGGKISLGDNPNNRIIGAAAADVLNNVNNTIVGAGALGAGQLSFTNGAAGVVNANLTNALTLNTGSNAVTNSGLLEATLAGGGGLIIQSAVNNGTTGRITAAGGNVYLQGATIAGGILATSGAGNIIDNGGETLDGTTNTVTNNGTFTTANNQALTLLGTITNTGTISQASVGNLTDLIIGPSGATAGTVTLTGAGHLVLSDNNANRIYGAIAADTLVNVNNTISGAGQFGVSQLILVNQAAGVINANASNSLTLSVGTTAIANSGLIEATGTGGLIIQNSSVNDTTGGTLSAAGGNIYLEGGTVIGGSIVTSLGGSLIDNGGGTLNGATQAVSNFGTVVVSNNQVLNLTGMITNHGTISLASVGNLTDLVVNSPTVTLNGGGTVLLSDNGANRIYGSAAANVLNNVNDKIMGAGQIGAGQLSLNNAAAGVINATGSNQLIINTGANVVSNSGLIEATGTGGLVIQNTTVNNTTLGKITASGGNVFLSGATIQGGSLNATGTGSFFDNAGATLDGIANTVTNNTTVTLDNNQTLNLLGTFTNIGTIALASVGNLTDLVLGNGANIGTVTLTGGGQIVMSDNTANRIYGVTGAETLINLNNTISGAGQIGAGQLIFTNDATINANATNSLTINTVGTLTNNGLIEATSTGGIVIQSRIDSSGGGTIAAAGGNVTLQGATIAGGIMTSSGGAAFIDVSSATLDGSAHTLSNRASVTVQNNQTLYLLGSIVNNGTITDSSVGNLTDILLQGSQVTLTGTGTIALTDNGANRLYGVSGATILDNVSNTISGAGQLGAGQLTLINGGIIEAVGTNALHVALGGNTGMNLASGQMLGVGAGGLSIDSGTYSNSGLIQADDGSSVTFQTSATLTNLAAGTITGGSFGAVANGHGATLNLGGTAITTDAATLILSGAGSSIIAGGQTLEATLTTIAAHSQLELLNGRGYTTTQRLTDKGILTIAGGTLAAKALTIAAPGTLSGFGKINNAVVDSGTITAVGGTLDLLGHTQSISGTVSGTGTLSFDRTTATLAVGTSLSVSNIAVINASTIGLSTSVGYGGTFNIVGAGTVSDLGGGSFTNTGLFEHTGGGIATVGAAFTNTGSISDDAGSTLSFTAALSGTGSITDNGVFNSTAGITAGTLAIGAAGAAASISTGAGATGSTIGTLSLAGGTLNAGKAVTVTGDYTNTATGTGNAYNANAGVTGTINANGTQLAVVGVAGTTITVVNGVETITLAPGGTAHFKIENLGAAGSAALRGALQTTVNGGHITDPSLAGSGVRAANFGAIAAGTASPTYTITETGTGVLSGQSIHLISDFANVAGLTINIVSGPAAAAATPEPSGWVNTDLHQADFLTLPTHHAL